MEKKISVSFYVLICSVVSYRNEEPESVKREGGRNDREGGREGASWTAA